jgi:hypothetical protein
LSDATTPLALGVGQRSDRVVIEKKYRKRGGA